MTRVRGKLFRCRWAKKPGEFIDFAGEHGVFHIKVDGYRRKIRRTSTSADIDELLR
jgi:hypothetical protein